MTFQKSVSNGYAGNLNTDAALPSDEEGKLCHVTISILLDDCQYDELFII